MKTGLLLLILVLALTGVVPALAQDTTSAPLIFFAHGLYLLNEKTGQVTPWNECGQGEGLTLSPTGEWLARLDNGDGLRLCNIRTHEIVDVVAPGPAPEHPFPSYPAWSPDGMQVAWSVGETNGSHSLDVYDLTTGTARVLVGNLPKLHSMRPQVIWGKSGILIVVDDQNDANRVVPLYAPDGKLLQGNLASSQYFASYFWVTDQSGKEYLGRYSNYVTGDIVDPATGQTYFAGEIQLYSPLAPQGLSVTMRFEPPGAYITIENDQKLPIADLSNALNDFVPYLQFAPTNVALSPDGKAVAFFDLDQLIWRDGNITPIPESIPSADGTGVIWGPMAHRIVGELLSPLG